jgi:hypothetical protein
LCLGCKRQFKGGRKLDNDLLWQQYTLGKQTYLQLSVLYQCSVKTIQRRLDTISISATGVSPGPVVVLMDTTYFGRGFGVMLFKDALSGTNLLKYYLASETNEFYHRGIETLWKQGFEIKGIVCDGRKGLMGAFGPVAMQMCCFHQVAILRRYLTKRPRSEAAKELKALGDLLTKTDKESFCGSLQAWAQKWDGYLKERTTNADTGKTTYTHRKLRSAYRSLRTNLPWLFTWYDHHGSGIPNTTNAIDGHFADLKNKLRNHNGMTLKRKKRFIDEFLKA